MARRIGIFLYGVLCYGIFLGVFLYAIGFLGDFGVPKSIDGGAAGPLGVALAIDAGLLTLFAVQHSVMARPWFKRAWTKVVPPAAERSTYVLFASLAMALLFAKWQPIGGVIWQVGDPLGRSAIYAAYGFGWALLLIATFLIHHFDLFGLRQVYLHLRGREYTSLRFSTPGFYRLVRHPIYLSWLTIFWATPRMTTAHLVFAVATTVYILMAIPWEERDLMALYGETYRLYREQTPAILPLLFRKPTSREAVAVRASVIAILLFAGVTSARAGFISPTADPFPSGVPGAGFTTAGVVCFPTVCFANPTSNNFTYNDTAFGNGDETVFMNETFSGTMYTSICDPVTFACTAGSLLGSFAGAATTTFVFDDYTPGETGTFTAQMTADNFTLEPADGYGHYFNLTLDTSQPNTGTLSIAPLYGGGYDVSLDFDAIYGLFTVDPDSGGVSGLEAPFGLSESLTASSPEPSPGWLLVSGGLLMAFRRGRLRFAVMGRG